MAKGKRPPCRHGRSGSLGTVMYVAKDYVLNTTLWVKGSKKRHPYSTYLLRAMKLEAITAVAVPTLKSK